MASATRAEGSPCPGPWGSARGPGLTRGETGGRRESHQDSKESGEVRGRNLAPRKLGIEGTPRRTRQRGAGPSAASERCQRRRHAEHTSVAPARSLTSSDRLTVSPDNSMRLSGSPCWTGGSRSGQRSRAPNPQGAGGRAAVWMRREPPDGSLRSGYDGDLRAPCMPLRVTEWSQAAGQNASPRAAGRVRGGWPSAGGKSAVTITRGPGAWALWSVGAAAGATDPGIGPRRPSRPRSQGGHRGAVPRS